MRRAWKIGCSAVATAATLLFLRDWLQLNSPLLVVMALFVAGCAAYAMWNALELAGLLTEIRKPSQPMVSAGGPVSVPELSRSRAASVRRIIAALAAEGVFAPEVPVASALYDPIAERDEPPNQEVVLTALHEANYYVASFDPKRHLANLAFHDSKAEQFEETIAGQISDLARLCADHLQITDVAIDHPLVDGRRTQPPCCISFLANGRRVEISYIPAAKYLSTHLHFAIAGALREQGKGRRLAWLWNDQGAWICALHEGGAERLNAAPGAVKRGFEGWSWIDEATPFAAGER
jgi:hypothetical protein